MKTIRLQIQATVLKAILEIALFLPSLVINQRLFRVFGPAERVLRLGRQKLSKESQSMQTSFMGTNFSILTFRKHAFQNWSSPELVQTSVVLLLDSHLVLFLLFCHKMLNLSSTFTSNPTMVHCLDLRIQEPSKETTENIGMLLRYWWIDSIIGNKFFKKSGSFPLV